MVKKLLSATALGLLFLVSLLPLWFLYFIADLFFVILYYVVGYRREVIDTNLLNAFPEKSDDERQLIRKQYTHYLADMVVETVKLFTMSKSQVKKRVTVSNAELVTGSFASGQSVIGILGHYGNWEMNALRFSMLFDEPRMIVYKPLSSKVFDKAMINMRSRFGATLVAMKDTMRKLIQVRNERTVTVLVGDQTPARSEIKYFTNFFNQPTAVFQGAEKLAKLTNSVVVFCDIRLTRRGHYHCNFVPLFNSPKETAEHEITDTHVRYLEQVIRQQPQYWLWSHRRWKFTPHDVFGQEAKEVAMHSINTMQQASA